MTDEDFSLFQKIIAYVLSFIDAGLFTLLFYPYHKQRVFYINKKIIKCTIIFLAYLAVSFINILIPDFGIMGMILLVVLMSVLAPIIQNNRLFAIFLTMIFLCIKRSIGLVGNSMLYLLNSKLAYGKPMEIALRNTAFHYVMVYSIELLLSVLFIVFIGKVMNKALKPGVKEFGYLSVLPLVGIVFAEIVDRLLFVVKDHVAFGIYDDYPAFLIFVPIIAVLFLIGIILTILSYQEICGLEEEKRKYFVEEQQILTMQERIDEVEQFYTGIRKMRHEMKNHMTNIRGLLKNKDYTEIDSYISKIDGELDYFEMSIKTGNPVLDVIINDKKKLAEKNGIQFKTDFLYPLSDNYNPYDIGIIVNNLLINAIEACERMKGDDKFVFISGKQKKKFYMIEVSNSYEGEICVDESSGLPISTKDEEGSLHGMGLMNVRAEAFKYMGDVDICKKSKSFHVTVLLQEKIERWNDHEN